MALAAPRSPRFCLAAANRRAALRSPKTAWASQSKAPLHPDRSTHRSGFFPTPHPTPTHRQMRTTIVFQADPALLVAGGRRAQRWAAVDPTDSARPVPAREVLAALAAEGGDEDGGVHRALLRALQVGSFAIHRTPNRRWIGSCVHSFIHSSIPLHIHPEKACPFAAAFWEWPPLRPAHVLEGSPSDGGGTRFEFVLVDAPELLASVAGG